MANEYLALADMFRSVIRVDETGCFAMIKTTPVVSTGKLITCNRELSLESILRMMFIPDPANPYCFSIALDVSALNIPPTPECAALHTELITAVAGDTYTAPFEFIVGSIWKVYQNGVLLDASAYMQDPATGVITWNIPFDACTMTFFQLPCVGEPVVIPQYCDYTIRGLSNGVFEYIIIDGNSYQLSGNGVDQAGQDAVNASLIQALSDAGATYTLAEYDYQNAALSIRGSDKPVTFLGIGDVEFTLTQDC